MKILFYFIALTQIIFSQQFTKITTGSPVTDGGDSRAVNWIDYDNDGDLDLFVTNGPKPGEVNFFYENNGDGSFTKITGVAITQDVTPSDGSSWGDIDNDGDPDLFVANWYDQNNLLYKNNGDKTFKKITNSAVSTDAGYSETGSWGDYDNDGWLDLYVCNSEGRKRNFLYHNNGNGTFTKISAGPQSLNAYYSRNADWIDYNNDGLIDLFVTNENNQNENLYVNNGDGTFTSVTVQGLLTSGGNSTSSNWEDIDNDGDWDVLVTNYGGQKNFLFINNGDGTFSKMTDGPVVNDAADSFGSSFGDIDNDGDLDLYITNAFTGSSKTINYLYINNGKGIFTKDDNFSSADSGWAYGCAFGDYDKDGWLDLFVAKCFGAVENNALFRNNGGGTNWILLNLKAYKSNHSALGSIVKLKAQLSNGQVWQMRRVAGQNGYCGQNLQLHFGLDHASVIDTLIVQWPSGIRQTMTNIAVNQVLTIEEDTTLIATGINDIERPHGYKLYQNYPNPFNPSTMIKYSIKESTNPGLTTLKVYDSLGNEVSTLVNGEQQPGEYEFNFDGSKFASGIYYYHFTSGSFTDTKKLILLK